MKMCNNCGEEKPLDSFYQKNGKHRTPCKECSKAYYKGPTEGRRQSSRAFYKKITAEKRKYLYQKLLFASCMDCGESDIIVLEFDHVRDKKYGIAQLVASLYPLSTLNEEIKKCEIVCANCHRKRTAKRDGWYRSLVKSSPKVVKISEVDEDIVTF